MALGMLVGSPASCSQQTKKKVLAIGGLGKGFSTDSVTTALATVWKLGQESKLWDTYIHGTDSQLITKRSWGAIREELHYFDAIVGFYTTGELEWDEFAKGRFPVLYSR